jgi:hypothetical protein
MKKKIVLYDDEKRIAQIYVENLQKIEEVQKNFEISLLDDISFGKELTVLESRRNGYRAKKEQSTAISLLDDASIFIIDYDLLKYSAKGYLTGESVAYLARCFSKCEMIVGLNQFNSPAQTIFDLTLKGHPESYCDLNLSGGQICNSGLWGKTRPKYRPWYWPELTEYIITGQKRIEETKNHIDDSFIHVVGLEDIVDNLSTPADEFVELDIRKATFREFATESGKGLKKKDVNLDEDILATIAATRLSKWLERLVLAGQDILVDAPHLVSRYPSILKTDHKKREEWNKTTLSNLQDLPLYVEKIEQYRFKKDFWLSRPAWFLDSLSNSSQIAEITEPWKKENSKFRFCEDSSTFESLKNSREFRAGVNSVYVQRFINRPLIEGIDYQPKTKLK